MSSQARRLDPRAELGAAMVQGKIGDIRLQASVWTRSSAEHLTELTFDLDRYVSVEPRLRSARWVNDAQPRVGARVEVVAEVPFSIPLVGALLGAPKGIVTVTRWLPCRELGVTFVAPQFTGCAVVQLRSIDQRTYVQVDGVTRARNRLARLALSPLSSKLEQLATRSISRAIGRIDAATSE